MHNNFWQYARYIGIFGYIWDIEKYTFTLDNDIYADVNTFTEIYFKLE